MISTNLSHLGNEQVEEEATTRPDVLHFFYQGNFIFIREKLGNLEKGCLWQSCVHVFLCTNKMIIFSQIYTQCLTLHHTLFRQVAGFLMENS